MRFAISSLCAILGACQSPSAQPPHPAPVAAPTPVAEPAPAATTPPAPAEVACLENWPDDLRKAPTLVIPEAVVVCVDGKRFDGAALDELTQALGLSLSEGQKPKCAMGYPSLDFVTKDGAHTELQFCGNYGTKEGYFYFDGQKLAVANPAAVESWLRERGLSSGAKR